MNHEKIDLLIEKRPALATVIRPFAAVLRQRNALLDTIKSLIPAPDPQHAAARLASGVPMRAGIALDTMQAPLEHAITGLLPVLKTTFPGLNTSFSNLDAALRKQDLDLGALVNAFMEGDEPAFETAARHANGEAGSLEFLITWASSTVFHAARIPWSDCVDDRCWSQGFCPFCGSMPAMASLSKPPRPADEFLPCGGGQRYLHCFMCGHHWRIERNRCPACDANGKDNLIYYQESGEPAERIDACLKCGRYLICVDLRNNDASLPMDTMATGLVHLDCLAQEKGFSPMARTPWNRVDEPGP